MCKNRKYIQCTSRKNNPAQVAKISHMKYEINPALSAPSALQLSSNRARPFIFSYDTVGSALSHIWVVINAHAPCSDWLRARNMEFITCGVRGAVRRRRAAIRQYAAVYITPSPRYSAVILGHLFISRVFFLVERRTYCAVLLQGGHRQ